jgi:pyruvate,water dikinase
MPFRALFKHWSRRLFSPERLLRQTYESFKTLLDYDLESHELMAEFEALYYEDRREDFARIRDRYRHLAQSVAGMVAALEQMHPGQAGELRDYFNKYDFYIRLRLAPPEQFLIPPYVVGHDVSADVALVGSKSANLTRLNQAARAQIPPGFTITTTTFALLVEHNRLRPAIDLLLASIDLESGAGLEETSQALMTLVRRMEMPTPVRQEILRAYDQLAALSPKAPLLMAVRSSALHEDSGSSFAGQYHSVLNVSRDDLCAAYLEVLASKYTPQALVYRIQVGLSDEEAAMAVMVLAMVDAVSSGVVYTRDPAAGGGVTLLIHSTPGLGLSLVGGEVVPDVFLFPLHSTTPSRLIAANPATPPSLSMESAQQLAAIARDLETFFGNPQDIEWALDCHQELFILQSRPLRMAAVPPSPATAIVFPEVAPLLAGAQPASRGIAFGVVVHLEQKAQTTVPPGSVLVTRQIPPSLVRFIPHLKAVVCEQGALTGHFATVCREFGVVLLVAATGAMSRLPAGLEVTVDGTAGVVYSGRMGALLARQETAEPAVSSAFSQRIRALLDYITPLHLVDPEDTDFRPQSCRSLHDIIRYAHEKAVQTMFGLGDITSAASSHCKKMATDLPLGMYLLDIGGAFIDHGGTNIAPENLKAEPFLALWQGLGHPEIDWRTHPAFDWKRFGDMALAGGMASGNDKEFASYAIVSPDYLNLNMHFGYHFTLVDCLCGPEPRANYCQIRFAGGGGDYQGRTLRLMLLDRILGRLGFTVTIQGDLLDARVSAAPATDLKVLLVAVGRLLGMTRLLDMVLEEEEIEGFIAQFFQGAGRFSGSKDAPAGSAGR